MFVWTAKANDESAVENHFLMKLAKKAKQVEVLMGLFIESAVFQATKSSA